MTQRLFVYGTLRPGQRNEHMLNVIGGTWEEAYAHGHLKQLGWGAEYGYPGIVLDPQGDEVSGYIFSSENFDAHWERLDAFEGDEYERILVMVKTRDDRDVEAFIYALRQE